MRPVPTERGASVAIDGLTDGIYDVDIPKNSKDHKKRQPPFLGRRKKKSNSAAIPIRKFLIYITPHSKKIFIY
jgi:hypothetical protein